MPRALRSSASALFDSALDRHHTARTMRLLEDKLMLQHNVLFGGDRDTAVRPFPYDERDAQQMEAWDKAVKSLFPEMPESERNKIRQLTLGVDIKYWE